MTLPIRTHIRKLATVGREGGLKAFFSQLTAYTAKAADYLCKRNPSAEAISRLNHAASKAFKISATALNAVARILPDPFEHPAPNTAVTASQLPDRVPVSIVIPNYNNPDLLANCLASLFTVQNSVPFTVIVVDDASDAHYKPRLEHIVSTYPGVQLHFSNVNGGFAKTCNIGIRSSEPYHDIVLLNSDIICKDRWLDHLQQAAYQSERIGIAGPKLLYPCGTIQSAGIIRNPDAPDWFDHSYRHYPSNYLEANVARKVLAMTGACLYIKRSVINSIGLLDEQFAMAFEDVDYCFRAHQADYKTLYCPLSVLIHLESMSRGLVPTRKEENAKTLFWGKWNCPN